MNDVSGSDGLRAQALELGYQATAIGDREEYLSAAAQMLQTALSADAVGWNAMDAETGEGEVCHFPEPPWDRQRLAQQLIDVADDHPMVQSYIGPSARPDVAPRRLSDISTRSELLKTKAFTDLLRPMGAENQITILTGRMSARSGRCWAIARSGADFTDKELELAVVIQPILALLDRTIIGSTPAPVAAVAETVDRLGLTEREQEILRHLSTGLTADAIARLLRISAGTVRKHLQNCYRKLGCNDRLLAVERGRELGIIC